MDVDGQAHIGVEAFDVGYGSAYQVDADAPPAVACEIVEDGGALQCRTPDADGPGLGKVAFVDGVRRADARLTVTTNGLMCPGLAGAHGIGAVLAPNRSDADSAMHFEHLAVTRLAVWGGGLLHQLPTVGGWSWQSVSIADGGPDAPLQELQNRMRAAEGVLAEQLCGEGWLTIVDGPLNNIRSRDLPVIGYVKTHHRPLLDAEQWAKIPQLAVGQRTSLFSLRADVYSCYTRVGWPGAWASPWAGVVRLDVPSSVGLSDAATTVDRAALALPRFASAAHRDPRAPVNLQPVAALERRLHHDLGNPQIAARVVRESVRQLTTTRAGEPSTPQAGLADEPSEPPAGVGPGSGAAA